MAKTHRNRAATGLEQVGLARQWAPEARESYAPLTPQQGPIKIIEGHF